MEDGDEEVAKSIYEIKKEETRRREFLKIREATKKGRGATLPAVQVPQEEEGIDGMWEMLKVKRQEPEGWTKVTGRDEVTRKLIPWCERHFNQAEGTPFTRGAWVQKLDCLQEDSEVREIVDGRGVVLED